MHALVVSLVAIVLLFTFAVRIVAVDGDSMLPTLQDHDRLLLSCFADRYDAGDIVVVDRYTDDPLIKRVIAVAGDTVRIDNNRLYINGIYQQEEYIIGYTVQRDLTEEVTVPAGCVFVMGDNRTISKDSRMHEIGMVSCKDIVGRVVCRVWPPNAIRVYKNLDR
ncbi:MAG: signal peptidase I [Clostridia bacterium]|nr:signal peptidase I [Clostridia bacterium]